ncbi:tetratricopeptide repeat protein [Rhodanobacter ginsengisoli]|uniref:Tetratricopeptide repeat protein n=1 Tax=Rhodanobacter ginsengisoli TaxID=418646 RepID=A0ABW0QQ79_9GAMM
MHPTPSRPSWHRWILLAAFAVTTTVYWPGLSGGFVFDDFPNIVDNHGVQPHDASLSSLVNAALSSPSSEFKRPLASLSFAANYLASGLDPYWMKLTNLVIHLLNGLLVFLLTRALLRSSPVPRWPASLVGAHPVYKKGLPPVVRDALLPDHVEPLRTGCAPTIGGSIPETRSRIGVIAALVAAGWMLLPINLTGVLYVVQRMESMANLFVLLGLIGYVAGRRRMLEWDCPSTSSRGFILCLASITIPAAVGILAKETAVMLPLYALLIEWIVFDFQSRRNAALEPGPNALPPPPRDRRVIGLFLLVLVLPMIAGLAWLLPGILNSGAWASRDFTLTTRLLSEARIVVDYIGWTLLPTPGALSFYHDDFHISQGLLTPWSTLVSIVFLAALIVLMFWLRRRQPLAALGIALFLGCQLLTGTILPLELIYEHRNYFASFGLLLAVAPMLAAPRTAPFALPRHVLLGGLMVCWTALTAFTAYAWSNPLRLAEDLASRAPRSPRAQYELGRTYIIYSRYDPASPFTKLVYAPLERAAALPDSSILPEQALIFMNARMHLPIKDAWWISMIAKLKAHKPGVQDESSLAALTQCVREQRCDLPQAPMTAAFLAALAHPGSSPRLLATYGDYAWNVLDDHALGERMIQDAVNGSPNEPAYQITLIRMLAAQGRRAEAEHALQQLAALNIGGRLDHDLSTLHTLPGLK